MTDSGVSMLGIGMLARHLISVGLGLVATPVGLVLLDLGVVRWSQSAFQAMERDPAVVAMLLTLTGAAILGGVAALGRVSGAGPLSAGAFWAGIPTLWLLVDARSFMRVMSELPHVLDHPFWFGSGMVMFPFAAALLAGAGLAGRWTDRGSPAAAARG